MEKQIKDLMNDQFQRYRSVSYYVNTFSTLRHRVPPSLMELIDQLIHKYHTSVDSHIGHATNEDVQNLTKKIDEIMANVGLVGGLITSFLGEQNILIRAAALRSTWPSVYPGSRQFNALFDKDSLYRVLNLISKEAHRVGFVTEELSKKRTQLLTAVHSLVPGDVHEISVILAEFCVMDENLMAFQYGHKPKEAPEVNVSHLEAALKRVPVDPILFRDVVWTVVVGTAHFQSFQSERWTCFRDSVNALLIADEAIRGKVELDQKWENLWITQWRNFTKTIEASGQEIQLTVADLIEKAAAFTSQKSIADASTRLENIKSKIARNVHNGVIPAKSKHNEFMIRAANLSKDCTRFEMAILQSGEVSLREQKRLDKLEHSCDQLLLDSENVNIKVISIVERIAKLLIDFDAIITEISLGGLNRLAFLSTQTNYMASIKKCAAQLNTIQDSVLSNWSVSEKEQKSIDDFEDYVQKIKRLMQ